MYDEAEADKDLLEGDKEDPDDRENYKTAISEALEYAKQYSASSVNSDNPSSVINTHQSYPKITFLGTGSSVPSKYRNVSGILVEHQPGRYILMDCGEGTVIQLHRFFGKERARQILR